MTRHPDPPFLTNHPTRVPIDWAWAEDSKNIFIFSESKFLETPSENFRTAQKNQMTPTPPPQNRLIYISIDSSRRQDYEYVFFYRDWHMPPKSYENSPLLLPWCFNTVLTRNQCAPWFFMNCLCIARGLRTPFNGKSLPLRTPNCAAIEVRRAFSGALRRPHCADPQQQACMALNYRCQHCAGTWALRNQQWASTLLQPLLRSYKERTHVCSVVVPSLSRG